MIKKIVLSITLLAAVVLSAQARPEAEYKKLRITYELAPDGSLEMNCYKELKYNTHSSFNNYFGETFILYNPAFETVTVNASYTIQADGNKITTPDNAYNEVLPRVAAKAPAYNHLKELVITHTGLELGATVYLDYTIHSKAGYYPALDIDISLQGYAAMTDAIITVIVPEGLPINTLSMGNPTRKKTTANGKDTYTFAYRNIPAMTERLIPAYYKDYPHVLVNTYAPNEDPFNVISDAFNAAECTDELRTLAQSLGSEEKISQYVASSLADCPIPLSQTGYRMRTPQEVYNSAYGTQAEKTLLTFVLLKALGNNPVVYPIYPNGLDQMSTSFTKGLVSISQVSLTKPEAPKGIDITETVNVALTAADAQKVLYTLPTPRKGIATWRLSGLNTKRKLAMELPSTVSETYTYLISCEEGVRTNIKPATKTLSNGVGSVEIVLAKDKITRSLHIEKALLTPADYPAFRALMSLWENPTGKTFIVEKIK